MIRAALLFGGRSAEHEVSILSARSVAKAVAPDRVEFIPVFMTKDGHFTDPEISAAVLTGAQCTVHSALGAFSFESWIREANIDIVLPLIHGTGGEDGALQGYLETLEVPYAGSGVTASAVGMDKHHMKQAFAAAKLPLVDYVALTETDWKNERERVTRSVVNAMRLPYFVKPANSGSSVGVTKVKNDGEFAAAIELALRFDEKVLVERGIDAREIEVAVLGNEQPEASVPGEIVAGRDFYDYEDKYIENKSQLVIPAKLPKERFEDVRKIAVSAFKAIGAAGFARVDFFLERGTNRLYLNEINTIPGFTNISMYPKLWEATELKYPRLIERLLELGLERSRARAARRVKAMEWFEGVKSLT
ncbi:MAG TPA: D-alanine--D-alanine ligase family protein [Thermoanaerobaculia bacterium]|jgi:D-alanine-D-alanine ligase|nr:D-alanine--D-alanine ligase family protein [Thermoanaerobaculia bacterium]